jgi:hypothetical protein
VAACAASVARTTASLSACPAACTSEPRRRATRQRPSSRVSDSSATATLVAQFFACTSIVPPIVVSAISRCEWPTTTRSIPLTSRASRAATFSLGRRVAAVS